MGSFLSKEKSVIKPRDIQGKSIEWKWRKREGIRHFLLFLPQYLYLFSWHEEDGPAIQMKGSVRKENKKNSWKHVYVFTDQRFKKKKEYKETAGTRAGGHFFSLLICSCCWTWREMMRRNSRRDKDYTGMSKKTSRNPPSFSSSSSRTFHPLSSSWFWCRKWFFFSHSLTLRCYVFLPFLRLLPFFLLPDLLEVDGNLVWRPLFLFLALFLQEAFKSCKQFFSSLLVFVLHSSSLFVFTDHEVRKRRAVLKTWRERKEI